MQEIGKSLAKLRKAHGLKQSDIAKVLNVSQQVVSNIERGITEPDIEQLKKCADLFDISLDQLVGREYHKKESDKIEIEIMTHIKQMDKDRKKLCLDILNKVAQHRGNNNGDK